MYWQALTLFKKIVDTILLKSLKKSQNVGFWIIFRPGFSTYKIAAGICDAKWKFDRDLHFWAYLP